MVVMMMMIVMKVMTTTILNMTMVTRCTLGEWACTASCVTLGQTSGLCTDEGFLLHSRASMPQSPLLFPTRTIFQYIKDKGYKSLDWNTLKHVCTQTQGECQCSERSISLNNLRALLPSRCHLGASFCAATCNSIGQKNGTCVEKVSSRLICNWLCWEGIDMSEKHLVGHLVLVYAERSGHAQMNIYGKYPFIRFIRICGYPNISAYATRIFPVSKHSFSRIMRINQNTYRNA